MPFHLRVAVALLAFAFGGLILLAVGSVNDAKASAAERASYILAISTSAQHLLRASDLEGLAQSTGASQQLACGHVVQLGPVGVGADCHRLVAQR